MIRRPELIEIDKRAPRPGRSPWLRVYALLVVMALALLWGLW
jgi:hypothetical protein